MSNILVNDLDIHYTIDGEKGPWITLSHSLASDLTAWNEQVAVLKGHFRVLRFDSRGHGKTSAPLGPYELSDMAKDVRSLFQHLGIERTHWIGLSMGGMIGQTFALAYPGFFQSMILAESTSRRPAGAAAMWGARIETARAHGMGALVESTLVRWFTPRFKESNPSMMQRITQGILNTSVDGFCGCCAAIAKVDLLDELRTIDCPSLIMVGEHDHGTPPEMSQNMHQALRGSELLIIPDAGHISNLEQVDIFNAAMLSFLAKHTD